MSQTGGIDRNTTKVRSVLAASSVAAGIIHVAVVPEHFDEAWFFGLFFILAGSFQIAWAIPVVSRPSSAVDGSGMLVNGGIIGVWLLSRTAGLPIGPDAWVPEVAGALDVAATLLEIIVVGSLVILRVRSRSDGHEHARGDSSSWLPSR